MPKLAYEQVDRDLTSLVGNRVSEAIKSVVQLADTPGQAYIITQFAASVALADAAGAFAAWQGMGKEEVNPIKLGHAVLLAIEEAT